MKIEVFDRNELAGDLFRAAQELDSDQPLTVLQIMKIRDDVRLVAERLVELHVEG